MTDIKIPQQECSSDLSLDSDLDDLDLRSSLKGIVSPKIGLQFEQVLTSGSVPKVFDFCCQQQDYKHWVILASIINPDMADELAQASIKKSQVDKRHKDIEDIEQPAVRSTIRLEAGG